MKCRKILILILVSLFVANAALATKTPNRLQAFANICPTMGILLQSGVGYDRIVSESWALNITANYDLTGLMHSGYEGVNLEFGPKYFIWGHGNDSFSQGFIIHAAVGVAYASFSHDVFSSMPPIRISEWEWQTPVSAGVQYLYTFDSNMFFTVGLKSKLFAVQFTKEQPRIFSYAAPRLELALGYAF